ncbi:MAG: hypothetical protein CM1200mP13_08650 [Candidatus Pelagibacterales bacterium]|nr:MAG: hypothetical protein CM1200mP13_08650 [Pelagibacterales bacterium]
MLLIFLISCSQGAPEEFQSGEEVYEARCSACHGPNFEGRVDLVLIQILHLLHARFLLGSNYNKRKRGLCLLSD